MPTIFEACTEDLYMAQDAARAVGINPGDNVFLQCNLGDCGPNGSVTVPAGHRCTVKGFFWRGVHTRSPIGNWYLEIDMLDSPGQREVHTILRDVGTFVSLKPPPPGPPSTSLDYLLSDEFDNL